MKSLRLTLVSETFIPQVNGVSSTLDRLVRHLVSRRDRVQLIIPRSAEMQTWDKIHNDLLKDYTEIMENAALQPAALSA